MNPSFKVPLTFSDVPEAHNVRAGSGARDIVESSCSKALPSCVKSWGLSGISLQQQAVGADPKSGGAVIGCQDGTLYVFHRSHRGTSAIDPPHWSNQSSRPASPPQIPRSSHATSRSTSPASISLAPFNIISPRARIVSGVTAEQVQAPKNYVDFDDEPDKLKDMLKGRNPRERFSNSELSLDRGIAVETLPTPSVPFPVSSGQKHKGDPKSLLSAANSAAFTPKAFSAPTSPGGDSSPGTPYDITLRCHIVPRHTGAGRAVTAVQLLAGNRLLTILQETG